MTTLEITAIVPQDRRLLLQLPEGVAPGSHRVRVEIDPVAEEPPLDEVTPVAWSDNVLVYGGEGEFTGDIQQRIDLDREERMREIWGGPLS